MLTRRFLTVKEVAELLQVSEASVRHWIKFQHLRAINLGREWRVIPRDLEAFLATHETRGAANPSAEPGGGPTHIPARRSAAAPGLSDGASPPDGSGAGASSDAPPADADRGQGKRKPGA
jgi:excisionase family DNA binding protein